MIQMQAGETQLWRVSNSSADSILDLQVLFDGKPQTLQIAALDGVPTGSQDGTRRGKFVKARDILIPTAGRAEFLVSAPPHSVTDARLVTLAINTGPDGDNDPQRTLATIQTVAAPARLLRAPAPTPALATPTASFPNRLVSRGNSGSKILPRSSPQRSAAFTFPKIIRSCSFLLR